MIVVTGGLGFIGSNLIKKLNELGHENIVIIDSNINDKKLNNVKDLKFSEILDYQEYTRLNDYDIDFVYHLGARTDTTATELQPIAYLNYTFSKILLDLCAKKNIPIIYASSAATYGDGELGYDDNTDSTELKPLNLYGQTKNKFDIHVLREQTEKPDKWYGFKFFNVYGHGEFNKDFMASVVWHGYNQINDDKKIKLFKSGNINYKNGEQSRDFIYVDDIVDILTILLTNDIKNGIYNLGTGTARSFNDLANALIDAMGKGEIEYVDMPENLDDKYQYYTEAKMDKFSDELAYSFTSLEDGIKDYIDKL